MKGYWPFVGWGLFAIASVVILIASWMFIQSNFLEENVCEQAFEHTEQSEFGKSFIAQFEIGSRRVKFSEIANSYDFNCTHRCKDGSYDKECSPASEEQSVQYCSRTIETETCIHNLMIAGRYSDDQLVRSMRFWTTSSDEFQQE